MSKRSITKKDKERGDKLRDLGCIVCLNTRTIYTPPAIHHIDGQTKPGCHQLTLPLCKRHHQIKCNNARDLPAFLESWVSRHGDGRAAFEAAYGTEQELLEQVNGLIA